MSVTVPSPIQEVTLGNMVTFSAIVQKRDPATGALTAADDPGISLYLRDPDGVETIFNVTTVPAVTHVGAPDSGDYYLEFLPTKLGIWSWRWLGDVTAQGASEGLFDVISVYVAPQAPVDLTDLIIFTPKARRYCEGPYGPPQNRPPLGDDQLYAMLADGCADIIMASGNLFGHKLIVKERETRYGYPIKWQTDKVLDEWEGSVIVTQTALNYFFFCFRELRTSETIKNEGTEWQYTLSANVIRDYIASLKAQRDLALTGLKLHHPTLDRYASNIRVRDQATVALLEWWDNVSPGIGGGGMPGGQEAAVIPWTPGWSGGWTP